MRIAVIGGGISGMAAAYYLSRRHEAWLFEKEPRLGGHTHTINVDAGGGPLAVDTGFIVHNDRTYPNLVKLFAELGVKRQPADMSFSVACSATGYEYSSRGLGGFFAQPANLLQPRQYRLLREIFRFNREAPRLLRQRDAERISLGDFLEQGRYDPVFVERYLYPMASAVWSMAFDSIHAFPALTLIQFFDNHGMLGISTHPHWSALAGGSNTYIAPLSASYRDRIVTGARIDTVARTESAIELRFLDRPPMRFDQVVFACHGDQVLPLLESPSDAERGVLSSFATSRNEVCLHTDSRLLPRRAAARASWNYNLRATSGRAPAATVTYHINRLQSLRAREDYCVTLNANGDIDPSKTLRRLVYRHPIYDRRAIAAQARWSKISGARRTHFCGAYWFYGFHEDGLNSALRVARSLGVQC